VNLRSTLLTLLSVLLSATAHAQIVNGSLETGTASFGTTNLFGFGATYNNVSITTGNSTAATGWTADFDPAGQGWLVQRPTGDPLISTFGSRFVYLNNWESCFRQTVQLTVGQRYTLSACIAGMDQDGLAGDESTQFAFEVDADRNGGASYASEYSIQTVAATDVKGSFAGAVWKTYSYSFTAGGSGSGLQNYNLWISALNTNTPQSAPSSPFQLGVAVDCVTMQLAVVPEPSALSLLALAGLTLPLLQRRWRR
jgi:hypothetical protein